MGQSLDKEISFSRDLLKGKIAEVIFEQMFRDCGKFTILSFGYEKTVPEVAHQHVVEVQQVLENIRHAKRGRLRWKIVFNQICGG